MSQDGLDRPYSAIADSTGVAVISVTPESLQQWRISQVSVECDDNGAADGVARKNGYPVSPFVPTFDSIGGEPAIYLRPGDALTLTWSGCKPGAMCRAFVFYDQVDWA